MPRIPKSLLERIFRAAKGMRLPRLPALKLPTASIRRVASRPGIWETMGGAVRWSGKWIGRPFGIALGLGGATWLGGHLAGEAITKGRHAIGWYTPEEELQLQVEAWEKSLEMAQKEWEMYKDYLNTIRQMQEQEAQAQKQSILPEWLTGGGYPTTEGIFPSWQDLLNPPWGSWNEEKERRSAIDWLGLALPVSGVTLIALALILMATGGKKGRR